MTREHLLGVLSKAIIKSGKPPETAQEMLNACSLSELHSMYYRQVHSGLIKPDTAASEISQMDVDAERSRHQKELEQIKEESQERRLYSQAQSAADFELYRIRIAEPKRKAQLAQDEKTFGDAVRTLQSFAANQANFSLIRQVLGENFSVYSIQQGILSGALVLIPPTHEELNEYERVRIEKHNERLLNLNPVELRKEVRWEAEQRRIQAVQEEDSRQVEARHQLDQLIGFPALPEANSNGEALSSSFFKKLSNTNLQSFKNYIRTFGAAQITKALRERI